MGFHTASFRSWVRAKPVAAMRTGTPAPEFALATSFTLSRPAESLLCRRACGSRRQSDRSAAWPPPQQWQRGVQGGCGGCFSQRCPHCARPAPHCAECSRIASYSVCGTTASGANEVGTTHSGHSSTVDRIGRPFQASKASPNRPCGPGFAMDIDQTAAWMKLLSRRSARIVVTMGMPALIYRWYFGAHGLKSLAQNLALVGINPVRSTIVGSVEAMTDATRYRWLERLQDLGRRARDELT